jgi:hypothetical protein
MLSGMVSGTLSGKLRCMSGAFGGARIVLRECGCGFPDALPETPPSKTRFLPRRRLQAHASCLQCGQWVWRLFGATKQSGMSAGSHPNHEHLRRAARNSQPPPDPHSRFHRKLPELRVDGLPELVPTNTSESVPESAPLVVAQKFARNVCPATNAGTLFGHASGRVVPYYSIKTPLGTMKLHELPKGCLVRSGRFCPNACFDVRCSGRLVSEWLANSTRFRF